MKKLFKQIYEYLFPYLTSAPAVVQEHPTAAALQSQLMIQNGKLVLRATGRAPSLLAIPDGMAVNVVPHDDLKRVLAQAALWREWEPYVRGGINDLIASRARNEGPHPE